MDTYYDIVVLGGGVGGYTAAIQAAKHHLKVALIEGQFLGGVCLNQGCIPTKAYLKSAEVFRTVQRSAEFGIESSKATNTVDFQKIFERKEKIVTQLRQGVTYLMQKNKITVFTGWGTLSGQNQITVAQKDQTQVLHYQNLILATGSKPKQLPNLPVDGQNILTSEDLLKQTTLPKSMTIVGGGAIGLEWASLLADLGVEVQVLEYADHLLGQETKRAGQGIERALKRRGLQITTNAEVIGADSTGQGVTVRYRVAEEIQEIQSQQVLVAVGRQPMTKGLGLTQQKIALTKKGGIAVDTDYRTNQKNIFAIGDCIDTLQLAHVAMAEGIHAVEAIVGAPVEALAYDFVPRCIYTYPEVAVVGPTTIDAKEHPHVKTGKFPYTANGKALIEGETTGEIQVSVDADNDDVLQVIMIGEHAADMISEAGLGLYLNVSATEIAATVHPHPTLSEMVRQATLDASGMATDL